MKEQMKNNLARYEITLSPYACKSEDAFRIVEEKEDVRPAFSHDTDRIIYALSFTRYMKKTQVFSFREDDHLSKRITHVLFVSKIARTIGRALQLNEDLIEAIALGHDIGHTPLGHEGEKILDELSMEHLQEHFYHNVESVRNYLELEKGGKGLNLTVQVLDGILCHNGEMLEPIYQPSFKTKEQFLEEYRQCYVDAQVARRVRPMTLEGCVVRICDIIAYVGRDVEDAIRVGILKEEDVPREITSVLGRTNSEIINTLVTDIVNQSMGKPYIKMSDAVFQALTALKQFNYKYIYHYANTKEELRKYHDAFVSLYDVYLKALEEEDHHSSIYLFFLDQMGEEYRKKTKKERMVLDFLSGMTDDFFLREAKKASCKGLSNWIEKD